jgi:hypothetical protein
MVHGYWTSRSARNAVTARLTCLTHTDLYPRPEAPGSTLGWLWRAAEEGQDKRVVEALTVLNAVPRSRAHEET